MIVHICPGGLTAFLTPVIVTEKEEEVDQFFATDVFVWVWV
jgi:hypothetical protein